MAVLSSYLFGATRKWNVVKRELYIVITYSLHLFIIDRSGVHLTVSTSDTAVIV